MITDDTIPMLARAVTVRREPRGFLLYQRETDELYFLSEAGFGLCQMFDGTRTVGDLERNIASEGNGHAADLPQLRGFLQCLADRSVIELWD